MESIKAVVGPKLFYMMVDGLLILKSFFVVMESLLVYFSRCIFTQEGLSQCLGFRVTLQVTTTFLVRA